MKKNQCFATTLRYWHHLNMSQGSPAGKQVGFIAQELKNVIPELVKEEANSMLAIN